MMKKLLMGLLLLLVSGAVLAAWTAEDGNDDFTLYVDRATIRRNGNFVKMWDLKNFKKAIVHRGASVLSFRTQEEYDCKEEKRRRLALTTFSGQMGSGAVTHTENITGEWAPVGPGSVGETQWKIACGKE